MPQNVNRVVLTGNLTRDPELRTASSGDLQICRMRMAVNSRSKRDGVWTDVANYFDVTVFGGQGENCQKFLTKGSPVAVDGRLAWREWTTDSGDKRQAVEVIGETVQFLSSGDGERKADRSQAGAGPSRQSLEDDDIPFLAEPYRFEFDPRELEHHERLIS
jgi:single-strand DNA-binding protein